MSSSRFSTGQSTTFSTSRSRREQTLPYDPSLRFSKKPQSRQTSKANVVYAINIPEFLRVITQDNKDSLCSITLAASSTYTGTGLWDSLFNISRHQPASACVLIAKEDYTPTPKSRLLSVSHFLNLSLPSTRIQLNEVVEGDKIGIGLYSVASTMCYVLLYRVDSFTTVTEKDVAADQTPTTLSCVNLSLMHYIEIAQNGQANIMSLGEEEYGDVAARPFVEWIADTVYDVPNGYAWKPHFALSIPRSFDRPHIEKMVKAQVEDAESVSFSEFETLCRTLYDDAKALRNVPAEGTDRKSNKAQVPVIPVARVGDKIYVQIEKTRSVCISTDDFGRYANTEQYLLFNDHQTDQGTILTLNGFEDQPAYFRYLSVNY